MYSLIRASYAAERRGMYPQRFKQDLQRLVNELNIEIRIAHYPPYTSKYNPIEHRLFLHLTRACQGVIFESIEVIKDLMEKATTQTGLTVFASVLDKAYQTGRKVTEASEQTMKIVFDEYFYPNEITLLSHRHHDSRFYLITILRASMSCRICCNLPCSWSATKGILIAHMS
ncbi:hypothetical protein [Trichocoleus sp. FACHB-46]|uniref:Transposase n=1 Tax=Trichocoleus desertorum GB2-A4 TaxID=2933944 RepID=A0ABV0JG32_9CYAN|nr:hypothetical protein [Trichocoleus sp. FACHB-46]